MSEPVTTPVAFFVTLHGKVQGDGLRKRIRKAAQEYAVKGWVRDRWAGHVQAHFEGPDHAVRNLLADLISGKIDSEISDFVSNATDVSGYEDFEIRTGADRHDIQSSVLSGAARRAHLMDRELSDIGKLILDMQPGRSKADDNKLHDLATVLPSRYLGEPFAPFVNSGKLPFSLYDVCGSFTAENWATKIATKEMQEHGILSPGRILNSKRNGLAFARALGVRTPRTFQKDTPLEDMNLSSGMALKPMAGTGANGVFCIFSDRKILHVVRKEYLESLDEMKSVIRSLGKRIRSPKRWMTEELILGEDGEIAHDLKFYCFYGLAHIVLEVNRTGDSFRYCWWNRDCERVETGKYLGKFLPGTSLSWEYIETAERISRLLPTPFMRIDFLKSADGPVFGEFTPRPGNFEGFDAATDAWLGRCYAEARGRLMADLMKGKRFEEYDAFMTSLNA